MKEPVVCLCNLIDEIKTSEEYLKYVEIKKKLSEKEDYQVLKMSYENTSTYENDYQKIKKQLQEYEKELHCYEKIINQQLDKISNFYQTQILQNN